MRVEPLLTAHDVFSLSVLLSVWESDRRISKVLVRDRHGIALITAEPSGAPQYHEIRLDGVPRGRFPIFVEITDGQGAVHGPDGVGPIFPAPTDANHIGGVPLPRVAVDIINDPEIRSLRATLVMGDVKAKAYERQQAVLLEELARLRDMATLPIVVMSVFAAALAVLAGMPTVRPWAPLIPMAVVVLLTIGVLRNSRRYQRLSRELEQLQARRADDLAPQQRAVQRLTALGVLARVAPSTTAGCGCGCGGHASEHGRGRQ
jgi:hypothetical protein